MNISDSSNFVFKPTSGIWPSTMQELLLRASLLQGSEAIDAWNILRSIIDINKLDTQSQDLLPLLYHNLRFHNIEDPLIKIFKGMYRLTWYKNHMLFKHITNTLESLLNAHIQIILLKGAALTTLYYKDLGLRPMADLDILVHPNQKRLAFDILLELGWRPKLKGLINIKDEFFTTLNAFGFQNPSGYELDLHWHLFKSFNWDDVDEDFWNGAIPIIFQDMPFFSLNSIDQLFHVCIHGVTHNMQIIRWIADAMMTISNKDSELDWNRLISQAHNQKLVLPLKDALFYLHCKLYAPIPIWLLKELEAYVPSNFEKREYKAYSRSIGLMGRIPKLWYKYQRNSQKSTTTVLIKHQISFLKYVQYSWRVENAWKMPFAIILKGIRRAWRTIVGKSF